MVQAVQPSFASGEISPELQSRIDLQLFNSACKKALNCLVKPTGGIINRPGTKYVAIVKDSAHKVRCVPFFVSNEDSYVIEFGHQYMRFCKSGSQIKSGAVPYELATPYLETDIFYVKLTGSNDVMYIVNSSYAPRTLSRYSDTNWALDLFPFKNGPFMANNTDQAKTITPSATTGNITLTANFDVFDAQHVGALWRFHKFMNGQSKGYTFTSGATGDTFLCKGTWRIYSSGTWTGTIKIEKSIDGGSNWSKVAEYSSTNNFNVNTYGTEENPCLIRVCCSSFTSGTIYTTLSIDPFWLDGIVKITTFTDSKHVNATVQQQIVDTSACWDWAECSWSNYRGWPSVVAFFEDRLVMGCTPSEPNAWWTSQTGNYIDFGKSDPLVDSDSCSAVIPTRQLATINNVVPLGKMMILSSLAEVTMGAIQGALTPNNIDQKAQSYWGSSKVEPALIGNRIIFVQTSGSSIRDLVYDLDTNSYDGDELIIKAQHLFADKTIVDMEYQQSPYSTVWCVKDDGKLNAMTYMKKQEVLAWTPHETDGKFESVCSIPGNGYNEVYFIVKRGNTRYIERFAKRIDSDPRDAFFVDCGISYDQPKTITNITNTNPSTVTCSKYDIYGNTLALSNGDLIEISDLTGLTIIDDDDKVTNTMSDKKYVVYNYSEVGGVETFKLAEDDAKVNVITGALTYGNPIDASDYSVYIEGGYVRKCVNSVSGLTHLNGKKVAILADGNVIDGITVNAGSITINQLAGRIHVGLKYKSDFESLRAEIQLQDGTSQGRKIKIAKVKFNFLNTRGGKIGSSFDSLKDIVWKDMFKGGIIPLSSGFQEHRVSGAYDTDISVCFRQEDPLPVTISSIVPDYVIGGG